MQLEKLDSEDGGDIYEEDFEATADDLPPLNESQVKRLEDGFKLSKKQLSVRSPMVVALLLSCS